MPHLSPSSFAHSSNTDLGEQANGGRKTVPTVDTAMNSHRSKRSNCGNLAISAAMLMTALSVASALEDEPQMVDSRGRDFHSIISASDDMLLMMSGAASADHAQTTATKDNAVASLDGGSASHRALQAALSCMQGGASASDLRNAVRTLAPHLGTERPEEASVRAIKAVLSKQLWPNKFDSTQLLCNAFEASPRRYYTYSAKVRELLSVGQSSTSSLSESGAGGGSNDSSTPHSAATHAVGTGCGNDGSTLASSGSTFVPTASTSSAPGLAYLSPGGKPHTYVSDHASLQWLTEYRRLDISSLTQDDVAWLCDLYSTTSPEFDVGMAHELGQPHTMAYTQPLDLAVAHIQAPLITSAIHNLHNNHFHDIRDD